jgi:hypothetical protein
MAASDSSPTEALGKRIDAKSFVVRAGRPATLLLDGAHVHIRIAVVCLENGAAGQTIRVASKDHRQTYTAKVSRRSSIEGQPVMTRLNARAWRRLPIAILLVVAVAQLGRGRIRQEKQNSNPRSTAGGLHRPKLQEQDVPGGLRENGWQSLVAQATRAGRSLHRLQGAQAERHHRHLVAVQTTAAQSGDSSYQRTFSTASAITGLAGIAEDHRLESAVQCQLRHRAQGAGATDSNTTFQTSLTGQVIAVLPSGNLVVEAQRKIFMNNQHEDVTVRGVVRPNDIGPSNTVSSASLSNLEIEMKGKGIIADSTRPLNPITKAMLWLIGF